MFQKQLDQKHCIVLAPFDVTYSDMDFLDDLIEIQNQLSQRFVRLELLY